MAIYFSKGQSGFEIRDIQEKLLALGFKLPRYGADGVFGSETEKAVRDFQYTWGLKVDGIVGPETYAAINEAINLLRNGLWNPNIDPMEYPIVSIIGGRPTINIPTPVSYTQPGIYKAQVDGDIKWVIIAAIVAVIAAGLIGNRSKHI